MAGALDGIKVLDLTSYIAGPFATMLLGDLGAEVLKVESPAKGDPFRTWEKEPKDYSPIFWSLNRNKKSLTLNLRSQSLPSTGLIREALPLVLGSTAAPCAWPLRPAQGRPCT